METPAKQVIDTATPSPLLDGSVARMFGWPVEAWLRCQAEMLKAAEPLTTGWLDRRCEAATAALDAFERLASCKDIEEIAAIQRAWIEGSMKRLDSDLHALADQAVALSQETIAATQRVAQTSSDAVARVAQTTQRVGEDAADVAA